MPVFFGGASSHLSNGPGRFPKLEVFIQYHSVLNDLNRDFTQLFWADDGFPVFTNRESYLKGYIEGVSDLWTKVSDKI